MHNRQSYSPFNNSVLIKGVLHLKQQQQQQKNSSLIYLSFRQDLLKDWQIMTKLIYLLRKKIYILVFCK